MLAGSDGAVTRRIRLRRLGFREYRGVYAAMQAFTSERSTDTPDEFWLTSHSPVYTQGRNGRPEHVLAPGSIPVVPVDRGGQVTYHGPGQAVLYPLLDLRRRHLGVRALVAHLEAAVITLLAELGIPGETRADAPGVYVGGAKIAALGLRVLRRGSYHGVSLNVDMDLEPFQRINPCGYAGLAVTQVVDCLPDPPSPALTWSALGERLASNLAAALGSELSTDPPPVDPGRTRA